MVGVLMGRIAGDRMWGKVIGKVGKLLVHKRGNLYYVVPVRHPTSAEKALAVVGTLHHEKTHYMRERLLARIADNQYLGVVHRTQNDVIPETTVGYESVSANVEEPRS